MAINNYSPMRQLGKLLSYKTKAITSSLGPMPQTSPVAGYGLLGDAAERERQALSQRSTERQNAVIGGYDQQIQNNRMLGDQGYNILAGNYDAISKDANDTRSRNMSRVDQYGNSMRSDLNVKAQQARATASQSAIKRGLGNTTIASSAERGAEFDNNRQRMALEDQLLQNRISTDTNLSSAYQNTLQNRAAGLGAQWNQNIANENTMTGQRLGYIGGIQEDMSGFNGVANLYAQQYGMQNQNEQNTLERDARTLEANTGRAFQAGETKLERDTRVLEANTGREFQSGETKLERDARLKEADAGRAFQAGETKLERDSKVSQAELDRSLQREQTDKQIGTQVSQAALDRAFQGDQSLLQREAQKQEADINRVWQDQQVKQDQLFKGKESAAERAARKEEAELDRQWQQGQATADRNSKVQQAALDRESQYRIASEGNQSQAQIAAASNLNQAQIAAAGNQTQYSIAQMNRPAQSYSFGTQSASSYRNPTERIDRSAARSSMRRR